MKQVKVLDKSALTLRNLVRHRVTPPSVFFVDRKKKALKERCRRRDD
jgi:hypothetical protein